MNRNETPEDYFARILSNVGPNDPWVVLATTARRLRELVAGRSVDELSRSADPSKWSVRQILAHLADAEIVAAWRFRSIMAADGVPLQPFDQDSWAVAPSCTMSCAASASTPMDVRAGTLVAAEPVTGSRKLAALRVDFGDHQRTIVAGLVQERDALEPLIGRQALFVVNLPPKQMAGVTSEGMLFDLGYADGITPALAVPEFPVPNGTRAG